MTAGTPDSAELLKVLRRLGHDADHRGVIRLVERWAEMGELPREARLEEARAFLDLRLMDRAWVRLKELQEKEPDDQETLLLIARLYVERGWPARARRALDRLSALGYEGADLADLSRRADQPPLEPPSDAREVERGGTPAQLLSLAEIFLATGSFLRARSLLERVRRQSPSNARAELLLWGIQGEFLRRGETLADLLRELGPAVREPDPEEGEGDWDTSEHTDTSVTDEGATEAPTTEVDLALEESREAPFPTLFRRPTTELPEDEDDEEPTVASHIATPKELESPLPDAGTDPGDGFSSQGGDTQIMAILPGPGRGLAPVDGPIHRPREAGATLEPLDLKAWQRSMGLGARDSQIPLEQQDPPSEDFLEDEDQDIVVMTRRELAGEEPASATTTAPRKPIEVVEKYPKPLVPPPAARAPTPAPLTPVPAPERPAFSEEDSQAAPPTDWTRLIVVMALTAGLLVGAGLLLYRGVQGFAADRVLSEAERVAAEGRLQELQDLQTRLREEIEAGSPPRWARQVASAQVALALWERAGDESLRDEARARLDQASDAPAAVSAELSASLALASGDLERAGQLARRLDLSRLSARAISARVALASGEPDRALELWEPAARSAPAVGHQLLWADILEAVGRAEEARGVRAALIEAHGEEPQVFLARQEQAWEGDDPQARLSALEGWLEGHPTLPARDRARASVLRGDLWMRLGEVERGVYAVAQAVEADPTYAPALYRRAAWSAYNGDLSAAVLDLERCLDVRPGDAACRRGLVQIRLGDGQRMEAAEVVNETLDARADDLLRAWLAMESGDAQRALELAPVPKTGEGSALYWLVRSEALLALGGGTDERARARAALERSIDPLDRLLLFQLDELMPTPTEATP